MISFYNLECELEKRFFIESEDENYKPVTNLIGEENFFVSSSSGEKLNIWNLFKEDQAIRELTISKAK
jgi:hypothetical protein